MSKDCVSDVLAPEVVEMGGMPREVIGDGDKLGVGEVFNVEEVLS